MPELTAADTAEYQVTFTTGSDVPETRTFAAAYVTAAEVPGMLAFKDHRHRIVAMVNANTVLTVERLGRGEHAPAKSAPGGVTLTKLPIPGAAGTSQTVFYPPETWSSNG